jgi:prephenate dehydrogenase
MERKKIAIIGVGLIGGSLAIQLHEKKISSRLIGVDIDPEHCRIALEKELVDECMDIDAAIKESEVIVLCLPMDQLLITLPYILDRAQDQIILDTGSAKEELIRRVKHHPNRKRYLATHPMWGTEHSGPDAAMREAFQNRALVICNSKDSDKDVVSWCREMYKKIGMHILEMDAKSHDLHAAYVSHISHVSSFALANTVLEKEKEEKAIFELASAGFASSVRLAKSNPNMWVPIFLQNKVNILDVLDEHIFQLQNFRTALQNDNSEGLQEFVCSANKIKKILR